MIVEVTTPDGPCPTTVIEPGSPGPWPAVIVFHDAAGPRPAQTRILERIAGMGYLAVQPDLFHRSPPLEELLGAPASLAAIRGVFADPARKARFMADYYRPALDYPNLEKTVGALLSHLAMTAGVTRFGTTGYCMGGNGSVRVATVFGKRIAAAAAFHPGGLVTDQPDSPHLRARAIAARLYLAPAIGDLTPEAEAKLRAELDTARVRYRVEHYEVNHGYAVDDSPAYDASAAERHYRALEALFGETF